MTLPADFSLTSTATGSPTATSSASLKPYEGGNGSYPYSGPTATATGTGTAGYGVPTGMVLFTGGASRVVAVEWGRWVMLLLGVLGVVV